MSRNKDFPGLACASEENAYQLLGDARYLYFVRLGKAGAADLSKAIAGPEDFASGWGNVRMPKTGVESVRCTQVRGQTVIIIAKGEKAYRFTADDVPDEDLLFEVFDGLPLRLTASSRKPAAQRADKFEIALFAACFALTLVRMGLSLTPVNDMLATLGWMLIPLIWLVRSARRAKDGETGFTLGFGAMASAFSCMFLWLSPTGTPDSWTPVILPAAIIALLTAGAYTAARRKIMPLIMLAVGAASLVCFAPGAVRCLNEALPARSVTSTGAAVVELSSQYDRGDWRYYVVIDVDEVQSAHQISREEYGLLTEESTVEVVRTTGALGISYTDVICGILGVE